MEEVETNKGSIKATSIAGILLILLGGLIFLDNFDIVDVQWRYYIFNWQVLLIVTGLFMLCDKKTKTAGYVLIIIGGVFLILKYLNISYMLYKIFWPSVLIVVGFALLMGQKKKRSNQPQNDQSPSSNFFKSTSYFGGNSQKPTAQNLTGGAITSVLGSSTINLHEVQLADGDCIVDVQCFLGGAKILVPAQWHIKIEASSIFGSVTDRRSVTPQATDSCPKLVIRGSVVAGKCIII